MTKDDDRQGAQPALGGRRIAAKLVELRRRVGTIPERTDSQGIRYLAAEEVITRVGKACDELGLATACRAARIVREETGQETTRSGARTHHYASCEVTIVVTDSESGEFELLAGAGSAYSDKQQVVSMAASYAEKDAWCTSLQLTKQARAEDDRSGRRDERTQARGSARGPVEPTRAEPARAPVPQPSETRQKIFRLLNKFPVREFLARFAISTINDLPEASEGEAVEWLENERARRNLAKVS